MNRALRSILLCILYIFFCAAPAMAAGTVTEQDAPVAEDLWLNAYSAILLDMDTGEVLYESNADEQNYPASTTKMMTALLTLENGDPKDMVTVSETAIDAIPSTASQWGLVPGEELSVHQLLQLMLVVSASEATTVAAEYVAAAPKSGPAMVDPDTLPEAPDAEDETREDQEVTPSPSPVPSLTPPPVETYAPLAAAAPVSSTEPAPVPVAAAGLPAAISGPMPLFFGAIAVILFGLIITLIVLLVRRRD